MRYLRVEETHKPLFATIERTGVFEVTNTTPTPLFVHAGAGTVNHSYEEREGSGWRDRSNRCGTGLSPRTLEPGERLEFETRFPDPPREFRVGVILLFEADSEQFAIAWSPTVDPRR